MAGLNNYGNIIPQGMDTKSDQALLTLVNARKTHSQTYHASYFKQVAGWYDDYRGYYSGRVSPHRNNISIPLIYSVVWSDVAKKVQSTFGAWPIVSFKGNGPGDSAIAKKNEILISAQLKECNSFKKAVDYFASADIYGTAVMRTGWTHIERLRMTRQVFLDQVVEIPQPVVDFDGPDWQPVDILDYWPQPGKKSVEEMAWCIHRYYVDFDDLQEMNAGDSPVFSKRAMKELAEHPISGADENLMYQRWSVYRSYNEWMARRSETFAKPVEITEMWGLVPQEFAKDGIRHRVVTVANGKVVLRNDPNPYEHGKLPFVSFSPTPDPHYFHGVGKVQIAQKLQAASNRLVNQKLDAIDLIVSPMYIGDAGKIPQTQNLFTKPGRIFLVDGKPSDALEPLQVNTQGLQAAFMELDALWKYMQQGTGSIEDTVMGMSGGSDRQTAYEFRGRQEGAMTRLALESMLASTAIEELAEHFRDLNKQYLPLPKQVKMIGANAIINPITGLPLPAEAPLIQMGDLDHDFKAQAVGPLMMMTKGAMRQDGLQLMQTMASNPVLLGVTNWIAFAKKIYDLYDWDATEMLVTETPMINAMASQQGMTPEGIVDMSANPMDAMREQGGAQQTPEPVGA